MADIIHLLPDAIANQIAAGEVVQRPASVVKELLENSIDAGSTQIQLILNDAGRSLIQTVDDGRGMSMIDARMCFERHATSKIREINDIFSIYTMGFRGEAMASIAAVAQVELKSRQSTDTIGTHIRIEGSKVISQEPISHHVGTSIIVRNLFFNVPARRNFLKSNQVELKHIIDEFTRIALAHPHIGFSFHHNSIELFHFNTGNLRQRIVSLFGKQVNDKLVPVEEMTDYVSVSGFIGKPEIAKKTRGEQFFFVNNRFIKSQFLNYAVSKAFEELIPEKSFPFYILFIQINPAAIDVNVHPTKQEIKFEDERSVFMIIQAAVKHGLAQYSVTPSLDFTQEAQFSNLEAVKYTPRADERILNKYTGGHGFSSSSGHQTPLTTPQKANWQTILPSAMQAASDIITLKSQMDDENFEKSNRNSLFDEADVYTPFEPIQLHQKYILTQIKSGLVLIDQQHAVERICFERYLKSLEARSSASQQSLFPKSIEFSPQDSFLLAEMLPDLKKIGFDIQIFGQNTFIVHGLPEENTGEDEQSILEMMLESYKESYGSESLSKKERLAQSLAKGIAQKSIKKLDNREIKTIIEDLFACAEPNYTMNGKKTFITLTLQEIERKFING
ncbi:MAG: DNA mismatch repair endonuclease MutL [Chitinophagales bacterium]|nr:DNA mismatch repair endonuclease MutL [Chitinophagales bacterium]MCZ2392575.1 DNA mismatch repair endonuclease MutL [Chitinophagales bacterium]